MTRKTTQTKKELVNATFDRVERLSLAEGRDKLYEKFYNNVRILTATETISMVDLARQLGMQSGKRIYELNYGKGTPSTEELIALSKHFKCTIDDLLNKSARISWQ